MQGRVRDLEAMVAEMVDAEELDAVEAGGLSRTGTRTTWNRRPKARASVCTGFYPTGESQRHALI